MNLMELKGICKCYRQGGLLGGKKEIQVLRDVSLTVSEGQCVGLLGASGCGKSTLGRIALGLERPDGGEVYYRGHDIESLKGDDKKRWRRNCQVVFQDSHGSVNPRHPAWKIIAEPLSNFEPTHESELKKKAAMLMKRVGLSESWLNRLSHRFSGGELQRICIARALALEPAFILLDEAVSSLDMLNQSLILDLLAELKSETGTAFLFISHDLRLILKMCDSLAVMDGGRITALINNPEELARPDSVYDPAFNRLARAVLAAEPLSAGRARF